MNELSTRAILERANQLLRQAKLSLDDLESQDPERRVAAMRNIIVWTRGVTQVLQKLRSTVPDFDSWYEPYQKEMENDPLLRYLYLLRNDILKEGKTPPVSFSIHITSMSTSDLGPPPPNARGMFIGDQLGGIGWEIELDDGTVEKQYVKLPETQVQMWHGFADAPDSHLGEPLKDNSFQNICRLYLAYLDRLVHDARSTFDSTERSI